uniref:NADH-ubiquinone oxidoreductase chain 6 n=1 Tax=Eudohrnia metallica TaxID=2021301 RepID=A0A678PDN7_9NEOP|nr:NADH dehydrogenase subunit 6 [Eudohrnia metallica]
MTKLLILLLSFWVGIAFSGATHPLAMGLALMIQTLLVALLVGMTTQTFWYGYVLFLVFLGGMLVLFLYTTSLASNELFSPSWGFMGSTFGVSFTGWIVFLLKGELHFNSQPNPLEVETSAFNSFSPCPVDLFFLYSYPTMYLTLFLAWYLLVALLVVAKVIDISVGPLRPGF